jgi:hypothetical protein
MVYAATSHNRSVYASPPYGGSGFRFARSAAPPTPNSTHIFASPGNLRFPFSGLQKRRKQPERYAKYNFEIIRLASAAIHGGTKKNT